MALVDGKFEFGSSDGFAIAAAFWNEVGTEDPEIGQLKFVIKSWSSPAEQVQFRELR